MRVFLSPSSSPSAAGYDRTARAPLAPTDHGHLQAQRRDRSFFSVRRDRLFGRSKGQAAGEEDGRDKFFFPPSS